MYRAAVHPLHGELLECNDPQSKARIDFQAIFPTLKPGSQALGKIIAAVDGHLFVPCCNDSPTDTGTFDEIDITEPAPAGWSIDDAGDLNLAFEYTALGRFFLATATVPRANIINAVAPEYRAMFVPTPRGN